MKTPLKRVQGHKAKALAQELAHTLAEQKAKATAAAAAAAGLLRKNKPAPDAVPADHVVAWIVRCAEAVKRDGCPEAATAILASIDTYAELSECRFRAAQPPGSMFGRPTP